MERKHAFFALAVLFAINTMNFFDRQIIGVVGEQIRKAWALSDTALGTLGTAFILIYAIVGLPLGGLADRFNRKTILGAGVLLWSLLTAVSGVCKNFGQLFVARLGVGLGEASCAPAASSLIGDLFPTERRANALSVFMLGLPIGIALSFLIGGYVAKQHGWQIAFFVAAAPGLLCALATLFLREPSRGAAEAHAIGGAKREGSSIRLVLSIPSMWPIALSGALHNFNMYALGGFMAPLLMRYHHKDIAQAGFISMFVYGLSGVPGLIFGGILADKLAKRASNGRMLLSAGMFFVAAPLTYLGLSSDPGNIAGFAVPTAFGIAAMYVYYSTTYATIQDFVEPTLRGTAMATYFFAMYLLGASLGPVLMGKLSDHFTLAAAHAAGVTDITVKSLEPFKGIGLHRATLVVPVLNLVLTLCMLAAARTVPRDVEKLQAWMRRSAANA